jgi:hypothetical protein
MCVNEADVAGLSAGLKMVINNLIADQKPMVCAISQPDSNECVWRVK